MKDCPVILVAEDDEDYVILIRQVFAKAHIPNPIHVVWNGEEAISYLKGEGKYTNRDARPAAFFDTRCRTFSCSI